MKPRVFTISSIKKPFIITIEGEPDVGKTTLLLSISKLFPDYIYIRNTGYTDLYGLKCPKVVESFTELCAIISREQTRSSGHLIAIDDFDLEYYVYEDEYANHLPCMVDLADKAVQICRSISDPCLPPVAMLFVNHASQVLYPDVSGRHLLRDNFFPSLLQSLVTFEIELLSITRDDVVKQWIEVWNAGKGESVLTISFDCSRAIWHDRFVQAVKDRLLPFLSAQLEDWRQPIRPLRKPYDK